MLEFGAGVLVLFPLYYPCIPNDLVGEPEDSAVESEVSDVELEELVPEAENPILDLEGSDTGFEVVLESECQPHLNVQTR